MHERTDGNVESGRSMLESWNVKKHMENVEVNVLEYNVKLTTL